MLFLHIFQRHLFFNKENKYACYKQTTTTKKKTNIWNLRWTLEATGWAQVPCIPLPGIWFTNLSKEWPIVCHYEENINVNNTHCLLFSGLPFLPWLYVNSHRSQQNLQVFGWSFLDNSGGVKPSVPSNFYSLTECNSSITSNYVLHIVLISRSQSSWENVNWVLKQFIFNIWNFF